MDLVAALLAAFFEALEVVAAFADALALADLAFFPPNIASQPFAYFSLVPTRVIVTVHSPNVVNLNVVPSNDLWMHGPFGTVRASDVPISVKKQDWSSRVARKVDEH